MVRIREMRLVSYIAVLLLCTMYAGPAALAAKPLGGSSVVVFPFEIAEAAGFEDLGTDIAKSLQTNLSAAEGYRAFVYSDHLPSVQRALLEASIKQSDLAGPFGTEKSQVAAALKLAKEMAADLMLVGSVENANADAANNKGEVTVTTELVDVRTGRTLKTIAVTGTVPSGASPESDRDAIALATASAVSTIVDEVGQAAPAGANAAIIPEGKKSNKTGRTILTILLGVAVGLLASGGGGGSSTGGLDHPPGPPSD